MEKLLEYTADACGVRFMGGPRQFVGSSMGTFTGRCAVRAVCAWKRKWGLEVNGEEALNIERGHTSMCWRNNGSRRIDWL